MSLRSVALLAFFAGSLPVCFIRPFYGILLWIVIAFLNPQSYLWGDAATYRWAMAVAIPTILGVSFFPSGWNPPFRTREVVLLLAVLWIWITDHHLVSTHTPLFMHHSADTWDRWDFVSKVLLMTFSAIAMVDSFARLTTSCAGNRGMLRLLCHQVIPFHDSTGGAYRLYGPPNSMIADNNDFGLALNMTLPFFFFLSQSESKPWMKRMFGVLFVITVPAIFFTYSRGAFWPGCSCDFGMFLQLQLNQRLLLMPVILGGLVAAFFAPQGWKASNGLHSPKVVDESAQRAERLGVCPAPGQRLSNYRRRISSPLHPSCSRDMRQMRWTSRGRIVFISGLLAEHGVIGLGLYLTLVVSCLMGARGLAREARLYDDRVVLNYINIFRFSLAAFLTSGIFLGRAYFDYFFTIVACLAILRRVAHQEWDGAGGGRRGGGNDNRAR